MKSITLSRFYYAWQIDKLLFVLIGAFGIPFVFHLIPQASSQPLGSVWLPIFYAPLFAVICCPRHVALLAAVMAPWINYFLLGMPQLPMARMLTLELTLFVLIALALRKINQHFWALGAVAYFLTKCVTLMLLQQQKFSQLFISLAHAKAGILVLVLIGFFGFKRKEERKSIDV